MQKQPIQKLRIPPHNLDSEIIILGSMLLNPETAIPQVKNILVPEDFYREAHQNICQAIYELGKDADIISVSNWLQSHELLEKSGGQNYIIDLVEKVGVSVALKNHLETVKDLSQRRKLIHLCSDIGNNCFNLSQQINDVEANLKDGLRLIDGQKPDDAEDVFKIISRRIDIYEARSHGNQTVGILTGFKGIDNHLHGLQAQCTYYIQAESQSGKSSLALHISDNIVDANPDKKVLYFTLESSRDFLTDRRISRKSQIPLTRLQTGNIHDEYEWEKIIREIPEQLSKNLIILDSSRYRTIETLIAFCESYSLKHQLILIVIDHLQLTSSIKRYQNRHLELSAISRDLNFLAKDLNVPLLILSQVNAEGQSKESRDIFNNADVVIHLKREKDEPTGKLVCEKGRDTGTWNCELGFEQKMMTWKDL